MERLRDGKRGALPELGCLETRDVKLEKPSSSHVHYDDRLPNQHDEPHTPLRFPRGQWSAPLEFFNERLGRPLGTLLRPMKHLRGQQGVSVVYQGARDPRIRE